MITIAIGSKNPVKIESVKLAFSKMFPDQKFLFQGFSVDSGVSGQPIGELETKKGAQNRVNNIFKTNPDFDYYVGIEGGSKHTKIGMETFAWVYIKSKNKQNSFGRTASFFLPKPIVALIKTGKELGEADDIFFNRSNSKQSNGAIGILTHDVITRTIYYESAVILALIPFKNPDIY